MRNGAASAFGDGGEVIGIRRLFQINHKENYLRRFAPQLRETFVKFEYVLHITDDKHAIPMVDV